MAWWTQRAVGNGGRSRSGWIRREAAIRAKDLLFDITQHLDVLLESRGDGAVLVQELDSPDEQFF